MNTKNKMLTKKGVEESLSKMYDIIKDMDVRESEKVRITSALNRIVGHLSKPETSKGEEIDILIDIAEEVIECRPGELFSRNRRKDLVYARAAISHLLREYYGLGYVAIGRIFKINHSSVINYTKVISNAIDGYNRDAHYIYMRIREEAEEVLTKKD